MITINLIGNSITGSYATTKDGKPVSINYGVNFTQEKYDAMKVLEKAVADAKSMAEYNSIVEKFALLATESFTETVATVTPYIHVNQATGKFYLMLDGVVSSVAMPQSFVDRILKSIDKGIDVLPLVKFWVRVLRNPKYTAQKAERLCNYIAKTYVDQEMVSTLIEEEGVSHEVARERATGLQTPITQEGLLCTYKVSTEIKHKWVLDKDGNKDCVDRYAGAKTICDITGKVTTEDLTPKDVEDRIFQPAVMRGSGDEFMCDGVLGHVIRVGAVHSLGDWDQVNCNDNQSCVKGLHVGNLDYIRGYQHADTETHYTFVDPMHVGAVTDDGSGALRVKQYYTYRSFAGVTRSIYHSSTYAKLTDEEWEKMMADAIKEHGEFMDAIAKDEAKAKAELGALNLANVK